MPTHFCVSGQTAEDFMRLFVNRLAYCIQREKAHPNDGAPYIKQKRPLDLGAVRMHLNGDATISLFAINPKTQSCKWVAIDADFDDALDALFELRRELKEDGIEAALEQSRRGGHLWIFGEHPLLASQCRIYIQPRTPPRGPRQGWGPQGRDRGLPSAGSDCRRRLRKCHPGSIGRSSQDESALLVLRRRYHPGGAARLPARAEEAHGRGTRNPHSRNATATSLPIASARAVRSTDTDRGTTGVSHTRLRADHRQTGQP